MLVIKRKASESILIGEDIEIIITDISQDKVQLAIKAPKEIIITRKELAETCEFNKMASKKVNIKSLNNVKNKFKNTKI
ncbi:MAG: carbon storage regulator [Tissierellia bacterium]|nr:carbon storage regulator [Tissierellia bacterium]